MIPLILIFIFIIMILTGISVFIASASPLKLAILGAIILGAIWIYVTQGGRRR